MTVDAVQRMNHAERRHIHGKSWKRRLIEALPQRLQLAAIALWTFRQREGRWPNILFPREMRERQQARMILDRDRRIPPLADKVLVKDYVRAKLGPDWVIPTLWAGKVLPPPAERIWPLPFVVKVNSGCGWNIFVRTEEECDWPAIERQCQDWLSSPFALRRGEWIYTQIDPQILIEPFIGAGDTLPVDYKCWTFHGHVAFIAVITERKNGAFRLTLYDRDWQRIPAHMGFPTSDVEIAKPVSLAAMIAGAEALAEGFSFVRVDLYEVDGRPVFGEMTFTPGAGLNPLYPATFDRYVLQLWKGRKGSMTGRSTTGESISAPYPATVASSETSMKPPD